MPSGGARARSGPAPDPDALRRARPSDQAGWETLPGPREGDPPEWPLSSVPTDPDDNGEEAWFVNAHERELTLWAEEWKRPQARKWEENGQEVEVAMYVRTLVSAELPGASAGMRTLVVRQQETLGISLSGLARNRWRIGPSVEQAQVSADAVSRAADRGWSVVKGGG